MSSVLLALDDFGQITDSSGQKKTIKRFTWTNSNNVSVQLITYGGFITSIKLPDNKVIKMHTSGQPLDVVPTE
ncbi:hypothetical protein NQ315_014350 [Exocentrus adspersus]|uniref:Uncharacterized protein n=1 Tax=Exocentrus adspersus TaxID=1586481 RepID=A0AAV8VMK9_9CUCU|nr:hypothetical protein NQ315_014350 [Exocentrus adspersus]